MELRIGITSKEDARILSCFVEMSLRQVKQDNKDKVRRLVGGAGQAVADSAPVRRVWRKFHSDPVESLVIQSVKRGVKLRCVVGGLFGHATLFGCCGIVVQPQIRTFTGLREMSTTNEEHASSGAVMLFVLAGGAISYTGFGFRWRDGVRSVLD